VLGLAECSACLPLTAYNSSRSALPLFQFVWFVARGRVTNLAANSELSPPLSRQTACWVMERLLLARASS
jgi:hypothetical protein